jgi:aquaporin related protein
LDATSNGGNSSQTIVIISLGYGFSLLVTAWTLYRVSGGLFNPAVSPHPTFSVPSFH